MSVDDATVQAGADLFLCPSGRSPLARISIETSPRVTRVRKPIMATWGNIGLVHQLEKSPKKRGFSTHVLIPKKAYALVAVKGSENGRKCIIPTGFKTVVSVNTSSFYCYDIFGL